MVRGRHHIIARASLALIVLISGCDRSEHASTGQPLKVINILGSLGDTPGRFAYPRCIDHDANSLWIIDKSARIQKIDPSTGTCLLTWKMPAWDLGKPTGFCVAPGTDDEGKWCDELLYIADTHYHRVMVYKPPASSTDNIHIEPKLVKQFGTYGTGHGEFYYCTDVAVLVDEQHKKVERIYVSEYGGNDRISIFDASGTFISSFGVQGLPTDASAEKPIVFNRPQSMVIRTTSTGNKELIVTDACNHRIGRFSLDGKLIAWIGPFDNPTGVHPAPAGVLSFPYGLCVLPDGSALISEFGASRIQRLNLDTGAFLGAWGTPGKNPGELAAPWGVASMGERSYVLDSANNRIVVIPTPN